MIFAKHLISQCTIFNEIGHCGSRNQKRGWTAFFVLFCSLDLSNAEFCPGKVLAGIEIPRRAGAGGGGGGGGYT